jgi:hypothetical protein
LESPPLDHSLRGLTSPIPVRLLLEEEEEEEVVEREGPPSR